MNIFIKFLTFIFLFSYNENKLIFISLSFIKIIDFRLKQKIIVSYYYYNM